MKFASHLKSSALGVLAMMFGMNTSHVSYAPPPRVGPKVQKGLGAERARKRLAAKLKANKAIPSGAYVSRQQRRSQARSEAKKVRIKPAEFARRKMSAINGGMRA